MCFGVVDVATGFQQALVIEDRYSNALFQALEEMWFRPYGLPIRIVVDPDLLSSTFQPRVQSLGCLLEFCPAEAHHVIAKVERRNALLRTIVEKLIDAFGVTQ